VLPC